MKMLYPVFVSFALFSSCKKSSQCGSDVGALLPMEGGYNFRDMGGIQTMNGKQIQCGKLLRSDDLAHLTEVDLQYLAAIPLISIVDFRYEDEVVAAPDKKPASLQNYYAYSINPGNLQASTIQSLGEITTEKVSLFMENMYISIVSDSVHVQTYKQFFALLQDESKLPLLFHCSAGKDRTGLAAAFFLSALGVDEETIMTNYVASNKHLEGKYDEYINKNAALKPFFEVHPTYLKTAFKTIDEKYGSMEQFLEKELNIDRAKLQAIYLN